MNNKPKTKGFTLIELLVVIAIIGLLSSVVLASLKTVRAKARDTRRLSDMHQMQIALELYYNSFGRYPAAGLTAGCSGWDTSADGKFMTSLVSNNFLPTDLLDPTINESCGNYVYYRYEAGYKGCVESFYTLGIKDMETSDNPHPSSPGWRCPERNWQSGFDWITGKYES